MEEYGLFIHGTASGVASITVWEGLRYFIGGPVLLLVGSAVSVLVIHQLRCMHLRHMRLNSDPRVRVVSLPDPEDTGDHDGEG